MLAQQEGPANRLAGDRFVLSGRRRHVERRHVLERHRVQRAGPPTLAHMHGAGTGTMHRRPGVGTEGTGGGIVVDRGTEQRGDGFVLEVVQAGLVAGGDPGNMAAGPGQDGTHHRR